MMDLLILRVFINEIENVWKGGLRSRKEVRETRNDFINLEELSLIN